jgi:hypothetical protein
VATTKHLSEVKAAALTAIQKFSADELAALAGGMALLPENLHHLGRLESLAMCVAAGCARGQRSVNRTSARKLLNGAMDAWVGHHDDESDTLATEAFTYHGGTHVFVAPWPASLFALRILAVVLGQADRFPTSFLDAATGLIQGICAISDRLVSRAGLVRNMVVPEVSRDISVPPEGSLMALLTAVRIGERELAAIAAQTKLRQADLKPLTALPGRVLLPDPPHASDYLARKPILRLQDGLVVIAPQRLAEALVHRLLGMSIEMGVHDVLVEVFHRDLFGAMHRNLERLGLELLTGGFTARSEMKDTLVTHAVYQCDRDKVVHVAVVSDALRVQNGNIGEQWDTHEIAKELAAARESLPQLLARAEPPIAQWFSLIIVGSIGREYKGIYVPAPKKDEPHMLIFTCVDLETIVLVEGAERSPLLLWKYAHALRNVETGSDVVSWSPLDKYALWREGNRIFPWAGNMLVINGPFGRSLRERVITQHDYHAIPARDPSNTIEVMLADGPERPIYVPRNAGYERVEIAVKGPGWVIWVVSSRELDSRIVSRVEWFDLGRMIAFWISEFAGQLPSEFTALGAVHNVVIVEFELMAPEMARPRGGYELINLRPGMIRASVHPSFVESYDNTNALEREFAADLVQYVLGPVPSGNDVAAVRQCMDEVAPIGVKRMMHRIDTARKPEFIGLNRLPRARHPHPADCFDVRKRILLKCPLNDDRMERPDAIKWLNNAVSIIYNELRGLLASFDARDLLVRLLLNNEALVYADANREITLASQLACYRSADMMRNRLIEEGPRHASASMATRFLVEHVAAEPPAGCRLVSDAELDTLLAMALELSKLGIASDVAHLELADVCIRTAEGDLIVERGTYEEAAQGAMFSSAREKIHQEQNRMYVPGDGGLGEQEQVSPLIKELEAASQEEFGVRLSDIGRILGEALALARGGSEAMLVVRRSEFMNQISTQLAWNTATVDSALGSLTLGPRSRYDKPPPGFHLGDIWPWRFNRGLSYIRRPFVMLHEPNDNSELYFTPGHAYRAWGNIMGLITSGRLKTRSTALSRVMGKITKEASDTFNEEVAKALRGRGMIVRTQVAKIGKAKIADEGGNTLGDIDVLCLDPEQCRVWAIECKDFEVARVPHEVRADLEALFISRGGKRCAQEKHLRRIDWLRQHLDLVVMWMGGNMTHGKWSVAGAFAFSVSLISPMLGHATLPVWTLRDLQDGTAP